MSMRRISAVLKISVTRSNVVSGVFLFAFLNGVSEIAFRSINTNGPLDALAGTFGISIIVFAGLCFALYSFSLEPGTLLAFRDLKLLAIPICLVIIPSPYFSWVAITMLALYERRNSAFGSSRRRGATLMFGLTIPMFWAKIVFTFLSSWILKGDALLVSAVTQSSTVGNVVSLPHQNGLLVIAPACSSFANLSLAVLCWLMFSEYAGRARVPGDYAVCFFACVNVVIVNVARISMIGLRPDLYDILHGPIGATVVSWLTAIVVLATCYNGIKRAPIVGRNSTVLNAASRV